MNQQDIRWQQRFSNYKKALLQLRSAVDLNGQRELSNLEKQGVIQVFEFTHELAWNMFKDYLEDQGNQNVKGSKDATREAFKVALITDGEQWMSMIQSRNVSSHTYNQNTAEERLKPLWNNIFHCSPSYKLKWKNSCHEYLASICPAPGNTCKTHQRLYAAQRH